MDGDKSSLAGCKNLGLKKPKIATLSAQPAQLTAHRRKARQMHMRASVCVPLTPSAGAGVTCRKVRVGVRGAPPPPGCGVRGGVRCGLVCRESAIAHDEVAAVPAASLGARAAPAAVAARRLRMLSEREALGDFEDDGGSVPHLDSLVSLTADMYERAAVSS